MVKAAADKKPKKTAFEKRLERLAALVEPFNGVHNSNKSRSLRRNHGVLRVGNPLN